MSSVLEELLPFVLLNINEFVHSEPYLSNQWMELHETYTVYIYDHSMIIHMHFHQDVYSNRGVIAL